MQVAKSTSRPLQGYTVVLVGSFRDGEFIHNRTRAREAATSAGAAVGDTITGKRDACVVVTTRGGMMDAPPLLRQVI